MSYKIAVLKGDGIGPDVVDCTIGVLNKVAAEHGTVFEYTEGLIGGIAIDETGVPLPGDTIEICKKSDAVLLGAVGGAVGGSKWDNPDGNLRPEAGLLGIRKELGLFANLRPAVIYPALKAASPLKPEIVGEGIDILVVRELTGGIYFGEKHTEEDFAYDQMMYSTSEVRRIAHVAFKAAMKRNKKVTSVDKANVLDVSRFWRKIVIEVSEEYPEVELVHMYVDNAAMQLIKDGEGFREPNEVIEPVDETIEVTNEVIELEKVDVEPGWRLRPGHGHRAVRRAAVRAAVRDRGLGVRWSPACRALPARARRVVGNLRSTSGRTVRRHAQARRIGPRAGAGYAPRRQRRGDHRQGLYRPARRPHAAGGRGRTTVFRCC